MADNLDPEVVAQFQEAMREAAEAARALPMAMNATVDAINKATNSIKGNSAVTNTDTKATEDHTRATKDLTEAEKAEKQAIEELLKVQELQKQALSNSVSALKSFADGLLSGERGFAKYNSALGSAGEAALNLGKSFGPLGAVLGGIVKGATMVGSAFLKQADDVLKATDELSKMGTAGAFSAEEVRKMGTGLGLASDQLDKFVKPVKSLGSSLISLGGNAADGATAFQKLAADLQTSRQEYQRLGISQEELIQNTADYINLQTQQGRQITDQMKRDGTLRVAAREYTDNLLELAALTGKDIESVKKKNELAMSEIETAIQNNLLDQEINRLRKEDTAESRARADQLEQERKARDKLLQRVENEVGDPALRKGLAKFLATGAITEEVAALKRIGVPVEDFAAKIKQGVDVSDQFMDSLSQNGDAMMRNVGTAAMFDENTRKSFGVSSEFMNYLAKARDRDEKSMSDLTRARIADTKAGKGQAGEDPAQKARNALTEAEIKAKVALDDMIASMNPLMNDFSKMDDKIKILIGVVIAATAAIAAMGVAAGANAAKGLMGKLEGTPLGRTGTTATLAKRVGGVAAVGMGAYAAYAGNKEIDEQAERGEISAAVAKEKKQDNTYGAAGGATGALVGGALGSLLGPVGTVVGGMAGQYFGEMAGKWVASWDDKKDPEAGAAISKAETEEKKFALAREKNALEGQVRDQSLSDAERNLAQLKLRNIQKEEALLLNQEALADYKAAKTPEEFAAATAKSDRARRTLAQTKTEDALYKLETARDDAEKKAATDALVAARTEAANVEIWRATQDFKKAKTEEEKKAIQERLDALKKGLQEEITAIQNNKSDSSSAAPAVVTAAPRQGITVRDAPQFDGGRAEGGPIGAGKFALVGEKGPEFISGPAQITNQKQMAEMLGSGFKESTKEFIDTFDATDKTVELFDKELSQFVKDDPTGKMTKQLNLVTVALEDLNELMDPMGPGGLGQVGPNLQPQTPSPQSIISAVMAGLSGMFGGIGRGRAIGGSNAPSSSTGGSSSSSGSSSTGGTTAPGASDSSSVPTTMPSSGGNSVPTAMPSSGGGGETQQGMEVRIGDEIRKGGTVSWRTNNPGNISYGPLAQKYGAIGRWIKPDGDQQQRTTGIAIFPTLEHGDNLKMALWRRPLYIDKTIDEGVMKWTGTVPSGSGYAKDLAKAANASLGTRIRDLSDPQLRSMIDKQKVWEGFKEGQVAKASAGGLFSGPSTGYPVEMHGNELVTRLDPNSLLEKLAKMPAQQIQNEISQSPRIESVTKTDDTMKEIASINTAMMEMLAEKLDDMISKLDVSNETQDKLLKFSQV